ncbi:unnamed protein product [Amaranthus hypochondriacus]
MIVDISIWNSEKGPSGFVILFIEEIHLSLKKSGTRACGNVMNLQINVDDQIGKITFLKKCWLSTLLE